MELELVNFEQAKALKGLGFPQSVLNDSLHNYPYYTDSDGFTYSLPPLELATKWIRDEKEIIIEPCCANINTYVIKVLIEQYDDYEEQYYMSNKIPELKYYNTYEEALSAGIDKAIGLLKRKYYEQKRT